MKKFVTAVAVVALVAFAAPVFAATNPFMDVPMNHWAYDAIGQLAAHGILSGYPDGTYKGKQPTTRYEMASALARALAVVVNIHGTVRACHRGGVQQIPAVERAGRPHCKHGIERIFDPGAEGLKTGFGLRVQAYLVAVFGAETAAAQIHPPSPVAGLVRGHDGGVGHV